ncbi:YveK family protein [Carnobacterium divergens]|uniref:Capsular polysaccharide biosynthesis protein CpsC n=1 Tax=Carnobacterium divergens TaxID=2748 RepID=A0AAW8RBX6_CARDV|nr:Wzz/FepE/Etk N-terminal domain-containing protein [Carnobacterium divergens]MDT1959014.1 Wzz/FepE/Etk N-terminal domain-containing protein [Carnobacterium divergens]MDT1974982.1 Wzz/FepE/Etk N-terminal domain-containing protein [Carnobacterium divergens]MDT2012946.1 Wzz/FepE/Etk N-terminal domain-containing protein [Carnobacterium divergens]
MEEIIDIKRLANIVENKKWWLVVTIIVSVISMSIYLWFIATPIYQSNTQILINQTEENDVTIQSQNVQANIDLINTYNVIMKSPRILDEVNKELNNEYSEKELVNAIQVSSVSNSQIIDIKVRSTSPNSANAIANTTATVFQREIVTLMKINNVTILSTANEAANSQPISPNKTLMLIYSFIFGIVLGLMSILIRILFDRSIKSSKDLEQFEITFLGTISEMPDE